MPALSECNYICPRPLHVPMQVWLKAALKFSNASMEIGLSQVWSILYAWWVCWEGQGDSKKQRLL